MRLIKARTLKLETFDDESKVPPYAILSHRWVQGQEVLLQDLLSRKDAEDIDLKGWSKIKKCCARALDDELEYVWIDTCCINKESSAELSEAINSMFQWYRTADRCYAYLHDVNVDREKHWSAEFKSSVWFQRSWTLQELIAPSRLDFFDRTWQPLGSRSCLLGEVSEASGIHKSVFDHTLSDLSGWSVAQRMSWASRRIATRTEDVAYSLLGIFDVNMPLLYGEGRRAFLRLQEEIIRRTNDHTIFAWSGSSGPQSELEFTGSLASSPTAFRQDGDIECQHFDPPLVYSLTNLGLQLHLRVKPWSPGLYIAALNCSRNSGDQIGIFLTEGKSSGTICFRVIFNGQSHVKWGKAPRNAKGEIIKIDTGNAPITFATQIRPLDEYNLRQAFNKCRMGFKVDIRSLLDRTEPGNVVTSQALMKEPASYPRTDTFSCCYVEPRTDHVVSCGDELIVISRMSSEVPQYGLLCILMFPLGSRHINAIKLGINSDGNPVCVMADGSNITTIGATPELDQLGCPTDHTPCEDPEGKFWQWSCHEVGGWTGCIDAKPGYLLPLRHPISYRREPGLWAIRGERNKSCSFRLAIGAEEERDSIVVTFGLETLSEEEILWKFSIDWSRHPDLQEFEDLV